MCNGFSTYRICTLFKLSYSVVTWENLNDYRLNGCTLTCIRRKRLWHWILSENTILLLEPRLAQRRTHLSLGRFVNNRGASFPRQGEFSCYFYLHRHTKCRQLTNLEWKWAKEVSSVGSSKLRNVNACRGARGVSGIICARQASGHGWFLQPSILLITWAHSKGRARLDDAWITINIFSQSRTVDWITGSNGRVVKALWLVGGAVQAREAFQIMSLLWQIVPESCKKIDDWNP